MPITSPKTKEELVRQFKFNPEVNTRLEAFMKAEPGLVNFVKELPREQLERKFLLRKMQDQQQKQGYDAKVQAWLEKPEQAELVKSLKATIRPSMKPEKQVQTLINQTKNYIRNTGIKISRGGQKCALNPITRPNDAACEWFLRSTFPTLPPSLRSSASPAAAARISFGV
jgi:hypothetical protein